MPIAEHVVVWAYRIILGREPEGAEVVAQWRSLEDPRDLAAQFLASAEHRDRQGGHFRPRVAVRPGPEALDAWYRLRHAAPAPANARVPGLHALHRSLAEQRPHPPDPSEPREIGVEVAGRAVVMGGPPDDAYFENIEGQAESFGQLHRLVAAALPGGGEGAVLVDGGAHLGLAAIAMGWAAPRLARLICFEPNHLLRPHLAANLRRNGLDLAELRAEALAAREGEALLHVVAGNASVAFLAEAGQPHIDAAALPVRCISLDALAARLPRLDVVKLDLEGSEPVVLAGARQAIARFRPLVHVEFNLWTLMRFARRNPVEVLEEWAALFPHLVVLRGGRPMPVEGARHRAILAHDILMSDRRFDDLILCHDLGWMDRYAP